MAIESIVTFEYILGNAKDLGLDVDLIEIGQDFTNYEKVIIKYNKDTSQLNGSEKRALTKLMTLIQQNIFWYIGVRLIVGSNHYSILYSLATGKATILRNHYDEV